MSSIKKLIIGAVGIMISLSLVPGMNDTVATITTPTYHVGVAGMAPVVLIVFFAAIIFVVLGLVEA